MTVPETKYKIEESRGKRATARAMLVFLGVMFMIGLSKENAGEYAKFLTPFIFTSALALYGTDAYFHNKQKRENT